MDKNKDSGVSGGVKFVTSTLGNVTGGLARTVGEQISYHAKRIPSDLIQAA